MPNQIVQHYRQQNPNDPRHDDEITLEYVQEYGLDKLKAYPDVVADYKRIELETRKATAPSGAGEIGRGLARGTDRFQGQLYGALGLAGELIPDALGGKELSDYGRAGYRLNLEEAAQNPPTIRDVSEISGPGDALRWFGGVAAENFPQMAATIGAAGAGGVLGAAGYGLRGLSATRAAGVAAGLSAAEAASLASAQATGLTAGGLAGFTQLQNYAELKDMPGATNVVPTAIGVGAVGAALELLPAVTFLKTMLPRVFGAAAGPVAEEILPRIIQHVPRQALLEGGTEVGQEIVTMAGEYFANRENPNFDISPEVIRNRILNAGVAGAALGGLAGGVAAIPGPRQPTTTDTNPYRRRDEQEQQRREEQEAIALERAAGVPTSQPMAPRPSPADLIAQNARNRAAEPFIEQDPDYVPLGYVRGLTEPDASVPISQVVLPDEITPTVPPPPPPVPTVAEIATVPPVEPDPFSGIQDRAVLNAEKITQRYKPVVKATDGTIVFGEHEAATKDLQKAGKEPAKNGRGYIDENGAFLTFLDVARLEQAKLESVVTPTPVAPPPVAPVPVVAQSAQTRVPFDLESVDWDNSALVQPEEGAKQKRGSRPVFDEITKDNTEYTVELGDRLTADAAASSNTKSKTWTRRVGFFESQESGEMFGLPVWKQKDVHYVANPDKPGSGIRLKTLMERGFTPMASVRVKEDLHGNQAENITAYEGFQEFENQVLLPGNERMSATISSALAVADAMQGSGTLSPSQTSGGVKKSAAGGGSAVFSPAEENKLEAFQADVLEAIGGFGNLSLDSVTAAVKRLSKGGTDAEQNNAAQFIYATLEEQLSLTGEQGGVAEGARRLYSTPQTRATDGEIKAKVAQLAIAAQNIGLGFDLVQAVSGQEELKGYSRKQRKVILVLHDAENPSNANLRAVIHEFGHDVYTHLPEPLRDAIQRGITNFTDRELGIEYAEPIRIDPSIPAAQRPAVINEERFIDSLTNEISDRAVATGIVQQIVQAIKEIYGRIAMAVQRVFGRAPSYELASAFARNRFEASLAGRDLERIGLFRFLIPPSKFIGGDMYYSTPLAEERLSADPKIEAQTHIAAWNEQLELEKQVELELIQSVPAVVQLAKDEGQTPAQWLREQVGIEDAKKLINAEGQRLDPETGLGLAPNPESRITDFQDDNSRMEAYRQGANLIRGQWNKVQQRIDKLSNDIDHPKDGVEAKRERKAERLQRESEPPKIPLPDEEEARRQTRIAQLAKDTLALDKERDELQMQRHALTQIIGLYYRKWNELEGPLGVHTPFLVGHKVKYTSIDNPLTWDGDDPKGVTEKEILLDANGKITDETERANEVANMELWLDKTTRRDGIYHQILAQRDEFIKSAWSKVQRDTDYTFLGLALSDVATKLKAIGSTLSRHSAQMLNRYTGVEKYVRDKLTEFANRGDKLHSEAVRALGLPREYYDRNVYDRALAYFDRRDIVEQYPNNPKRQRDAAMVGLRRIFTDRATNPQIATAILGKEEKFFTALRRDLEANIEVGEWIVANHLENNVFVRDESLGDNRVRTYITRGVGMVPRTLTQYFKQTVFNALVKLNWAAFGEVINDPDAGTISQLVNAQGVDAASARIAPFLADKRVMDGFVLPLASEVTKESTFFAPLMEDGVTRPRANPGHVHAALKGLRQDGNLVAFLARLHELHGGGENIGDYIQHNLLALSGAFNRMRHIMDQIDPGMKANKTLNTMIGRFMIDARGSEWMPSSWLTHIVFDNTPGVVPRISEKIAAQTVFGPDNEKLAKAMEDGKAENNEAIKKLKSARAELEKTGVVKGRRKVEAQLAAMVGGKEEFQRLRRLEKLGKQYESVRDDLVTYFSNRNNINKELGFLNLITGLLSKAMVNNPGTALGQFAAVMDPYLNLGFTPQSHKIALKTTTGTLGELAYGLVRSFGGTMQRNNRELARAFEYGQGDPQQSRKNMDVLREQGSPYRDESSFVRGARKVSTVMTSSVGSGEGYIGFRPLGPFQQINPALHITGVVNFIKIVQDHVMTGVEWAQKNPDEFGPEMAGLSPAEWADKLGLQGGIGGGEKEGFINIFQRALEDWGLDFFTMVKKGARATQSGSDVIDKQTWIALNGMWVALTSSQGNLVTLLPAAFNNKLLQSMLPLNSWAFRRALQVARMGLDAAGERATMAGLSKASLALAAMAGGGLLVSAVVDAYNEEILGRRRNLRRLTLSDPKNAALAFLEQTTRVGTFGMFGDVVNAFTNVATNEGANRGISLDSKVIFANSALGMAKAFSSFLHQGFEADYANVIRPAMFAFGGNGVLQYMQLANQLLPFDVNSPEARAVSRTNVGNWLRVVGRETGLEIRPSQGGYGTPTPMTPHITRMQLAAIGDDPDAFNAAYREALAEAREQGKADPANSVARSFQERHPLRTIFRVTPTEQDYRKILGALPPDGREDVQTAIALMNRYGARIGVSPFDGKETGAKAKTVRPLFDFDVVRSARDRAAMFSVGF